MEGISLINVLAIPQTKACCVIDGLYYMVDWVRAGFPVILRPIIEIT